MKKILPFLMFLIAMTTFAAEKRAFTIADLYRVQYVGDSQISPDGRQIAFTINRSNLEKGETHTDLWLVNADGTGLKQLTNDPASDTNPRWSPDGKSLLFVSTRKDGSQAWLLPMDGGEARQLTSFSYGVSDPIWSADGKKIIFNAEVFPEYGADDTLNERDSDSMADGVIQAHMADKLLYRHWTAYYDGKYVHTLVYDLETETVCDLTPGEYHAPRFSLGGHGYDVSSDNELCVVSNHDADPWSSTNADLFSYTLDGKTSGSNLTADNKAFDGNPYYSPDGKYIAYIMQKIPTFEADLFRLALYERATGKIRVLSESFDYWVTDFQWAPDSKSIYFTADVKGHTPLYKIDINSNQIKQILDAKTIDGFDISPDGKWAAILRRSVGEPVELYSVRLNGSHFKRLTFVNQPLTDEVDIRPAEEMWVEGAEGKSIHVFIVKPHGFDPGIQYPLILNVHGGPQMQWTDAFRGNWQVYPGAGYVVAFSNPHGSSGYGQDFTDAISKDWGGKVYEDVIKVADALAELPYVDANRMGAMGWSYGGYMMMWLEGHTDRFKALASMMGVYDLRSMYGATEELWFPEYDLDGQPWNSNLYEKWSPSHYVPNYKTPCLVITGERDYRVAYTQSLHFFTDLQKMQVPSRLIVFKNDGHWPSSIRSMPLYYNAHLDWFHKYLGGDPAPYDMTQMIRNRVFGKN